MGKFGSTKMQTQVPWYTEFWSREMGKIIHYRSTESWKRVCFRNYLSNISVFAMCTVMIAKECTWKYYKYFPRHWHTKINHLFSNIDIKYVFIICCQIPQRDSHIMASGTVYQIQVSGFVLNPRISQKSQVPSLDHALLVFLILALDSKKGVHWTVLHNSAQVSTLSC